MATSQIITQFRQKSDNNGNYETFYLGPELRFSGALPTSNNNNLEEQLLLGVDRIITTYVDEETQIEHEDIEFRRETDLNYYILEKAKYRNGTIYSKDDILTFDNDVTVDEENERLEINFKTDDIYTYSDITNSLSIIPSDTLIEADTLWYNENGTTTKISVKEIFQNIVDGNLVTKEVITNHLNV